MIIGISGKKQHGKDTVCSIIQVLTRIDNHGQDTKHWNNVLGSVVRQMPNSDWNNLFTWERKIFAGKLKETVALMIGCTVEQLEKEEFKNKPLGEEWSRLRMYGRDFTGELVRLKVYSSYEEARNSLDYKLWETHEIQYKWESVTPRIILQELGTEGMRNIHPDFHVNALFADYKPVPKYPNWIIPDVRFPNEVEAIRKRGGLVIRVENPRIKSTDNHASETSLDNFKDWDWQILNDGSINDLINKVSDFLYTKTLI